MTASSADRRLTLLERAFELASSGQFASLSDLKRKLADEGYEAVSAQMVGPALGRQLRALMTEAQRRAAGGDRGTGGG